MAFSLKLPICFFLLTMFHCAVSQTDVVLYMYDSGGDGWQGSTWEVSDQGTSVVVASGTLIGGSSGSEALQLPDGCYEILVGGVGSNDEISWELAYDIPNPFPDVVFLSGTAPDNQVFSIDGGCPQGCIDPTACNFDSEAVIDDGSCCAESCISMYMTDSGGDGWGDFFGEDSEYKIYSSEDELIISGLLEDGFEGTDLLCLADGCYYMVVGGGDSDFELGWTLSGIDGDPISGGAPETVVFTVGDAPCEGCTDPDNCMYEFWANVDDGSCCEDHCLTLQVLNYDSGVGGGSSFVIRDLYSEELVVSESLELSAQEFIGICIPLDGCYTIDIDIPAFGSISWQMSGTDQGTINGNSNVSSFSVGGLECPGCTDPEACNYDELSLVDDGSCSFCVLEDATCCEDFCINVSMSVDFPLVGGGSFSIVDLATGETVANESVSEVGSWDFTYCLSVGCYGFYASASQFLGDETTMSISVYQDETWIAGSSLDILDPNDEDFFVLGEVECYACVDPLACNFDPSMFLDDGSCTYPGCNIPSAENYDPEAGCDDGSCIVLGCTYSWALNYNPIANNDDGSCLLAETCGSDLDGDGLVSTSDLLMFLVDFGTQCPDD
jgi:hypothetical protein